MTKGARKLHRADGQERHLVVRFCSDFFVAPDSAGVLEEE